MNEDELTWRRIDSRLSEMEARLIAAVGGTATAILDLVTAVRVLAAREDRFEHLERRIEQLEA